MSTPAIEAIGLVKQYGSLRAVDGLDLRADNGTCLGLLGPNGAGKTTTIEMLEGLSTPNEGTIKLLGLTWKDNAQEIRENIGVQLQETTLQDKLTAKETLELFGSFYRDSRPLAEVVELVGLEEKLNDRVMNLSGGQKQRLALGCAMVNRPRLLFLDEPTTGLDPQARRRVWEVVEDFKKEGGTVILTTHYMDEAERLSDDLLIVDHGQVIASGSPHKIINSLGAESIVEFKLSNASAVDAINQSELDNLDGVIATSSIGATYTLKVVDTKTALSSLLSWLEQTSTVAEDIRTHRPTLEDVFVSLTGKQLRDN
ncbi:MAG: ABC-2 type transport system ATP-binding protein [Planctomycetota bacterium]|jgi:ABC-2 type transport system ATP-binding protein